MIILIPVFANKAKRSISRFLILPSLISLALTFFELFVSVKLHELLLNPLVRFITGVNINRNTRLNIINSGLKVSKEKNLALVDVFRLFEANKY